MNKREVNKLRAQIVRDNAGQSELGLLCWAMNQLFRAARTLDICATGAAVVTKDNPVLVGCDATAETILRRLVKTQEGYDMILACNPNLLGKRKRPNGKRA